jgi:hypothetical protein
VKARGQRNLNRHGAFEAVGSGQLPDIGSTASKSPGYPCSPDSA